MMVEPIEPGYYFVYYPENLQDLTDFDGIAIDQSVSMG